MWFGFALVGLAVFFCVFGNKQQEASQLYYDSDTAPKEQSKKKTTVKVDKQASAKPAKKKAPVEDMPADAPVDADTLAQSIYDETDV